MLRAYGPRGSQRGRPEERRNLNPLRHLCSHSDTLWDSGEAQEFSGGDERSPSARFREVLPGDHPRNRFDCLGFRRETPRGFRGVVLTANQKVGCRKVMWLPTRSAGRTEFSAETENIEMISAWKPFSFFRFRHTRISTRRVPPHSSLPLPVLQGALDRRSVRQFPRG